MKIKEYLKHHRHKKGKWLQRRKVKPPKEIRSIARALLADRDERDIMDLERPELMQPPAESLPFLF